jgi:peptidoglycan/LPS O-acetylase OafA/YrhL
MAYNDMGAGESWQRYCVTYALAISSFLLLTGNVRLDHPLLIWLGAVSYSLYLLHPSMLMVSQLLFDNTAASLLVIAPVGILLSLGAAHLSFRYIETPFIQFGKRLNNRNAKTHPLSV